MFFCVFLQTNLSLYEPINDILFMNHFLLLNIHDLFNRLPIYDQHDYDVSQHLATMAGWSSMMGILLAIVVLLAFSLINRYHKGVKLNMSGKFLTTAFVLVWLAGFVIYDVGMYIGHSRWSLLANIPMAIIHAFEMFILESDVAAIHSQFHDNWIFMMAFSIVHLLAAAITLIFVIKHFGYNVVSGLRMLYEAYCGRKKESFVFWGLNDASYLLAQSIKNYRGKSKDYRIIMVRTNKDRATSVKNGMERLFNFLSLRNSDLVRLQELDCLTTSTYSDLAHLNISLSEDDILRKHVNLRQLSRIIGKKTKGKAHLFFLGDDSSENIQSVANLKRDKTLNEYVNGDDYTVTLYCRARYNSVHRVIEDEQLHDKIEVKVIDSSHISVEVLKQHVEYHPVSYVDIETDATVSSQFNALVVGFGEVGIDSVRFLYEFGSFVKSGSANTVVERSEFHCDVVDPDMTHLAGLFLTNAPSIAAGMASSQASPAQNALITLHEMDARSMEFYRHVESCIKHLNYVVIAQNDDEQNISLAVRIFRLAVRYRKDMHHFRIMVLVKRDEDGHLERVAEHYNRLWAAEEHCENPIKRTHQKEIRNDERPHAPITLFGKMDTTFTYEYIVSDKLRNQAMMFKERYDKSIEAFTGQAPGTTPDWETEHKDLMQLTEAYKGYSPTYSGIMRLRRTKNQNMENCFHQLTKQKLAQVALGNQYEVFDEKRLKREENQITYSWTSGNPDSHVIQVLDVLARTEHLRWVASHEVLGYIDYGTENDKDEARLLHGCLKPWESLSIRIQSYDYNVVDVSLGIM